MIPKKRERIRSGIQRAPKREWPRHRKFVRSLECSVPNCGYAVMGMTPFCPVVECAHVRTGTDGGTGIKPADWWTIPLCSVHHGQQHRIGEVEFERQHRIDMKRIARDLAKRSPDADMREAMKEAGV